MRHLEIIDWFNNYTPYTIGFDRLVERLAQTTITDTYPPFNIIKEDEEKFKIEMAVAGFDKSEIEVTVADGILSIKSAKENKEDKDKILIILKLLKLIFLKMSSSSLSISFKNRNCVAIKNIKGKVS